MLHHALRAKGIPSSGTITPAFVKSVTSTTSTIATGTVAVGDLLILIDYCISQNTTIPTTVVPSGYTVLNNYGAVTGSGTSTRTIVSYRFSTVTTTTTLTGMSDFGQRKTLLVFNGGGSTATAFDFQNVSNTADPASITTTSGSGSVPLIVIANYQTNTSGTVNTPTFSPTEDGTVTNGTAQTVKYKIYTSSPSNVTADSGDGGSYNINGVGYIQIT
jgi:hypothetical protein